MSQRARPYPSLRRAPQLAFRSSTQQVAQRLFLAGALTILGIAVRSWILFPFPIPFAPTLPYQYTASIDPRFWLFLQQVSPCIRRGAEFTVIAPTAAEEHELYVLAVGAIPHAKPLAASYFGFRQRDHVTRARFVAVFDGAISPAMGSRETCSSSMGALYENGSW